MASSRSIKSRMEEINENRLVPAAAQRDLAIADFFKELTAFVRFIRESPILRKSLEVKK
jgi:hypothetical protein